MYIYIQAYVLVHPNASMNEGNARVCVTYDCVNANERKSPVTAV